MSRLILIVGACALVLSGCMLPASLVPPPSPTPVTITTPATATPPPTSIPVPPTRTPAPTVPMPTPAVSSTPQPPLADWRVAEVALRPAAAQTLDSEMARGSDLAHMTQYSLTVTLAPDLSRVSGTERVRYTNREQASLGEIYFHLFPNIWRDGVIVSDVTVAGRTAGPVLESNDELLRVPLSQALEPGQSVDIAMDFRVPVPVSTDVGNYGDFAYVDGILAMAHFYPTVVVYDANGWHLETPAPQGDVIYHDASQYDVSFTAPAYLTVAATGATLGRTDNGDGSATWHLAGGPMRDFNIAASQRYQTLSKQAGDVTVTSYFLPEHAVGGQKVLDWAAKALTVYQDQFGAYPYRDLDVVETGTTAGGIEYPGLVVISDQLYDDPNRPDFFEGATVHEVAHQWWYNMVGNDQVNEPWLDESLTQYSTSFYYDAVYGSDGVQNLIASFNSRWERVGFEDKPIGLPVSAYKDQEYSGIVYGRGALFFFALRDQIGADTMAELLRRYDAEYAWKIATSEDFRRLAEEVSGQNLGELWAKWVTG